MPANKNKSKSETSATGSPVIFGPDMFFCDFYDAYKDDLSSRLKESTWHTKAAIIEEKVLPYFRDMKVGDITTSDVMKWQEKLFELETRDGCPLSQTYLKMVYTQLNAMLNHAVQFYNLPENPARISPVLKETKEERQRRLDYRREHYRKNQEKIRERDNASARRSREADPERFRQYQRDFKARRNIRNRSTAKVKVSDNPQFDDIVAAIQAEDTQMGYHNTGN